MKRSSRKYWEALWRQDVNLMPINPRVKGLKHHVNRKFHEFFTQVFDGSDRTGMKLIEVGCARSLWLPYFAREFGFRVTGLDYSEAGCLQAEEILRGEGVVGDIVCSDFYTPPENMIEGFDVIVSFGVVEHFDDPAGVVAAFSKLLKAGGLMITIIPNMTRLVGWLQKLLDRCVYDIHNAIDHKQLAFAHVQSGLQVMSCSYFLASNWEVLNIEGRRGAILYWPLRKLQLLASVLSWLVEIKIPYIRPNPITSPYIVCLSRKRV